MSVSIRKGLALDIKNRLTGTGKNGRLWCAFLTHGDENKKDAMMVFASNPEEARFFTQAKVGNIIDVRKSAKRRLDGSWDTLVSITAHIDGLNETSVRDRDTYKSFAEAVEGVGEPTKDDFMDFTKAADFGDDQLPFN